MTKYSVKKPFTVLVAVVAIFVIAFVSLSKMTVDLMPDISLPYIMIITTEPGASPEKVEKDVTEPIEGKMGTLTGVRQVISTSASNYSMVVMEFSDDVDMDSTMVRVTAALNTIELPEECGQPSVMELGMDMMASMYLTVNYDEKNITEVSDFTRDVVVPELERQEGVASVTEMGMVDRTVEIRLDEDKINKKNTKILASTNKKLAKAQRKISKAKNELQSAKDKLSGQSDDLTDKQGETNDKLAEGLLQLNKAIALKEAYNSNLSSLKASEKALQAELEIYEKAKIKDNYKTINDTFKTLKATMGDAATAAGVEIPSSIEDALSDTGKLKKFTDWLTAIGKAETAAAFSEEGLKQINDVVNVRIPQINTGLANLKSEIATLEAVIKALDEKMPGLDKQYKKALSGSYSATSGFGAASAQMSAGQTQINDAEKELDNADKTLKDSIKAARENANLDALLSMDTLAGIITAQNFSMPAGYIDDKNNQQWLVKMGENYDSVDDLKNMVLADIKGIGKVRLKDVAKVVSLEEKGGGYAKVNGEEAVVLSVFKTSSASTGTLSDTINDAMKGLEEANPGLHLRTLSDQGVFIDILLKGILSSMLWGAILAIIVLALFLKSVKPTIIVAFSIPFSVLLSIVVMYFTNIGINVMSLAGLSLSIGMLVDNSIVVTENIYRLRGKGISAPRAAVQGTKQVAGPIAASTLTTICVFLPMVFTSGIVKEMVIPFAFTISYALMASLLVALTVVPAFSSTVMKKTNVKGHKFYDRIIDKYEVALRWCLKKKWLTVGVALVLLVFCIYMTGRMGLSMMPDMPGNTVEVMIQLPEKTEEKKAFALVDEVMARTMNIEGVDSVGGIDAGSTASMLAGQSSNGAQKYESFSLFVTVSEDMSKTSDIENIKKQIEESNSDLECEVTTSASAMAGSGLMSSGVAVNIYGHDMKELERISNDVENMLGEIDGVVETTDSFEDAGKEVFIDIDKNKAMSKGLTVAQIFAEIAGGLQNEKDVMQMTAGIDDYQVKVVDKTNSLKYEDLLDVELEVETKNAKGEAVVKEYKLSDFATLKEQTSPSAISREDQTRYVTVSAEIEEGLNATVLSRDIVKKVEGYELPDGYTIEVGGEYEQVMEMLEQMLLAIALGFLLIYLIMVAQFQSLLSPFIVLFTIPLAFTGGLIGLLIAGEQISAMALMGFMILMGTVVNNGIVFVDYINQLRKGGLDKTEAIVATGRTRMRPILMTAITTILGMSVMIFSNDASVAMSKGMSIVVAGGLLYATLMTLFVIPIMYDWLYRKTPKEIDVGGDELDVELDDAAMYLKEREI